MGMFMTKPSTIKHSDQGGDFEKYGVRYGVSGMQGWRVSMEDAHLALPELSRHQELSLFGVFDGHGGSVISEWVSRHIESIFEDELDTVMGEINLGKLELNSEKIKLPKKVVAISEALQRTYIKLDDQMAAPSSRPEQKAIYDKKKSSSDTNPPKTFLQELLGGIDGQRRVLRMVEQNGNRCLQIVSFNGDEDPENNEHEHSEGEKIEEVQEKRESIESTNDPKIFKPINNIALKDCESERAVSEDIIPFESDVKRVNDDNNYDSTDATFEDDTLGEDEGYLDDMSDSNACGPDHCGTTAVVAVIIPGENEETPFLIVANAGDSRAVLSRAGQAIALSHDHKPELPIENERILKAHGTVENGRVDGNLNMSRTLGDLQYKNDEALTPKEQKITAFPDVRIIPLTNEDEFVVLACDGIWDVVDNQLCVDIIRRKMILQISEELKIANSNGEKMTSEQFNKSGDLHESKEQKCVTSCLDGSTAIPAMSSIQLSIICEEICDECLAPNPVESEGIGCDNMTLMIVQLGPIIRNNSSNSLVSAKIGSAVARRLQATAAAIENQKFQSQKTSSETLTKEPSEDPNYRNEYSAQMESQSRKSPDAAVNIPLPSVPWIPKKDFQVVLYGYGIDDGRFDNLPENKF